MRVSKACRSGTVLMPKIYTDLRYNNNRKMEPVSNLGLYWGVFANEVPGWPVTAISTPEQYYFTMPSF